MLHTMQHDTTLRFPRPHNTILHYTTLHDTTLHDTIQHYTIQTRCYTTLHRYGVSYNHTGTRENCIIHSNTDSGILVGKWATPWSKGCEIKTGVCVMDNGQGLQCSVQCGKSAILCVDRVVQCSVVQCSVGKGPILGLRVVRSKLLRVVVFVSWIMVKVCSVQVQCRVAQRGKGAKFCVVQCQVVQCGVVWCVWCSVVQCSVKSRLVRVVVFTTLHFSFWKCLQVVSFVSRSKSYTTLHCPALHYTTLHYTTLHHTTLRWISFVSVRWSVCLVETNLPYQVSKSYNTTMERHHTTLHHTLPATSYNVILYKC